MASKARKGRSSSGDESPAEKKRRSEAAESPAEETEPIEPKGGKKGKHKRPDSEGSPNDVDELFKEPAEKDAEEDEPATPKKSSGKKQKEKKTELPVSPTRPKAPKPKKRREEGAEDAIFERVKQPNAATVAIVNDWVKHYKQDQGALTRDLINFVLHAAGSPGSVSADLFERGEINDVIEALASDAKYKEEGGDYPLVARAKTLKRFRANYADFWNKLIIACARTWVFDDYFMEVLDTWLGEISGASCRPFRHAATVAVMEIVAAALAKEKKVTSAQLVIEKKKKNETAAQLEAQVDDITKKIDRLQEIIHSFFETVFVHRYRDAGADIRVASITALSRWVSINPGYWLKDTFLKYLAWTLFDRTPEVRLAALRGMGDLYIECLRDAETDEEKERKKLFGDGLAAVTDRYKERLVTMVSDKDVSVAAAAIEVCQRLAALEVLDEADVDKILVLITDDSAALREAVAKFVADQLKGGARQSKVEAVRALVTFVVERIKYPDCPNYVIDALWDTTYTAAKDWSSMAELLAEQGSQALRAQEQGTLVRILACSVKKAMGVSIVPKDKPEKPEKASVREAYQKELTRALMKPLPDLLKAFQADGPVVSELIQLARFFPLEDFRGSRQMSIAKELLRLLRELFFLHTDAEVHTSVGNAFRSLLSGESSIYSDVDVAFHELTQQLYDKLEASLGTVLKGQKDKETDDEGHQFSLELSLQRLYSLLLSQRVPQGEFVDALQRVVDARSNKALQKHKSATSIVSLAVKSQALMLNWDVVSLGEEPANDRKKLQVVIERRDRYIDTLKRVISSGPSEQRTDAYFALLDTLVVFSPAMRGTTSEPLVYEADGDVNTHVQEQFKAIMALQSDSKEEEEEQLKVKEDALLALSRGLLFNTLNEAAAAQVALQLTSEEKPLLEIARSFIVGWRERKTGRKDHDVFFEALRMAYEAASAEEGTNAEMERYKLLCSRIATSYGVAAARWLRDSLLRLIRAMMLFAVQRAEQLGALEGLGVLVNRLASNEDAQFALKTLDDALAKAGVEPDEDNQQHSALIALRVQLDRRSRGIKGTAATAGEGEAPAPKKRGAPKKKPNTLKLVPVNADEAAEKSADEEGSEKKKRQKKADKEKETERKSKGSDEEKEDEKKKGKEKRKSKEGKEKAEEEEKEKETSEAEAPGDEKKKKKKRSKKGGK